MILRETFARTIPFGEEYIFLMGNHWAFFGFCVLFLLFKGCLKVWMMVWLVYEKQPALCFPNVQAAFYFSGSLHPQRIHNQLKHIRMPAAAGVIEVKRFVSDGVFGQ